MCVGRNAVSLALCGLLFTACEPAPGPNGAAGDAPAAQFEEVYAAAEEALAAAEARGNVWSKTDGLLRAAGTANDEGRVDEAIEFATEAKLQAELAAAQAEREKRAWQASVLPQ